MYEVKRVKNEQFENTFNYEIHQNDHVMFLSFEGNLDFYMSAVAREDYKKEKLCFTIDKSNYTIYSLFEELFDEIKNCNVFTNDADKYELMDEEDALEHINRINRMNEDLKKTYEYRKLVNRNLITWISDDSDFDYPDYVRIYKGEDAFYITFVRKSKDLHFGTSVRFRNSGSAYQPFNIPFMRFFNRLQEYDPEYHQVHIEELNVKRLTKKRD